VRARIGLGVELDAVGADGAHERHLLGHRIHEQAHARAAGLRLGDQRAQRSRVDAEIPPWSDVNCPSVSGTNVAWCGRTLAHEAHQVVEGVCPRC
jgi:hypothetical protein